MSRLIIAATLALSRQRSNAFQFGRLALWRKSALLFSSKEGGDSNAKLESLRDELRSRGVDGMVIPSDDPHLSEYVAACFERRGYISGFTGSAGTAVVTMDRALVWTDSRYWLQAEAELEPGWELQRSGSKGVPSITDFVGEEFANGKVCAIDASVTSAKLAYTLSEALEKSGGRLESWIMEKNPVDMVWGSDRPALPQKALRIHPLKYAGETASQKIESVRSAMRQHGAKTLAISALDEVCWLLNLRGRDVDCNPVSLSYVLLHVEGPTVLCIDEAKVDTEVMQHLEEANVVLKPYNAVLELLSAIESKDKVWLDPEKSSQALVAAADTPLLAPSPLSILKATKNQAEISGMHNAHIRDGAAAVRAFAEIDRRVKAGDPTLNECAVDQELLRARKRDPKFLEPSFPTIAGFAGNGAIVHYVAKPESCAKIDDSNFLLVDSGGQYLDGTTDVTRTFHFGRPTREQKDAFTRVLKGNIALDTAVFPATTPGCAIDAFARQHLWAAGLDYGHGTGHGVGAALNVHEGPQSISPRFANLQPLVAGMIVSNEPGFYLANSFGIRIENLLLVESAQFASSSSSSSASSEDRPQFLRFSKFTHIPIDTNCINIDLLNDSEIQWLDEYHQQVESKLAPLLSDDPQALAWLQDKCRPLHLVAQQNQQEPLVTAR